MSEHQQKDTCGKCRYGHIDKNPPMARTCYGVPPAVALVPQNGGMQLINVRPTVGINERACGIFKVKFIEGESHVNAV